MTSIFDLKNDIKDLPSVNQQIVNYRYRQVNCIRDVTGDNFPNGMQHFRWTVPRNEWWVPARSYFRLRGQLTQEDGTTQLTLAHGVAPAMGFMANLYQSGRIKLNQNDISVIDNFFAEIDMLSTRMEKSKAWLDGMGVSINWLSPKYEDRLNDISSDGLQGSAQHGVPTTVLYANQFQKLLLPADTTIAWTDTTNLVTFATATSAIPDVREIFSIGDTIQFTTDTTSVVVSALTSATTLTCVVLAHANIGAEAAIDYIVAKPASVYENSRRVRVFEIIWRPTMGLFSIDTALPLGTYEIVMSPQTGTAYKIRAAESLVAKTPGTGEDYNFKVNQLYFYAATMVASNISDGQYLIDLDETVCNIKPAAEENSEQTFEVSPSTYALTVAFTDSASGSSTNYPPSKFIVRANAERNLTSLQINYAGEDKPIPRAGVQYTGPIDYLQERYVDTMLYNGRFFDTGSAESFSDFLLRGPYFHFAWPKDGSDTSSSVTVRYGFSAPGLNTRMLLFHHKKRVAIIRIQNSEVVDVSVHDR